MSFADAQATAPDDAAVTTMAGVRRRSSRRATLAACCALGAALLLGGCRIDAAADTPHLAATPAPVAASDAAALSVLVGRAHVVAALPHVAGYQRSCSKGKACSFGPAWTDDTTAPLSHNGCDTRNDVLGQQVSNPMFKPGTHNCKVVGGTLHDPYSGRDLAFTPGSRTNAQIDHVFALQRIWDAGGSRWPLAQRERVANDPANLLAVNSSDNEAKGSEGPDTWLPPNTAFRCTYVTRYFQIADSYHLAVTRGDVDVVRRTCLNTPAGPQ